MSEQETALPFGCDDYLAVPTVAVWRGITVEAPAQAVWPWLGQLRAAPYSYDWVDNGGQRSPQRLLGLPEPTVGEPFTAVAGRRAGRILALDPGRQLTATLVGAYLSYLLRPLDGGGTRLLMKVVAGGPRILAPVLSVGDLVMARRQLLNLKRLAEE